jgi:hypothetical protein
VAAPAASEYRARLDDLQAKLEEAERFCDGGRAERLRAALDILKSQLSARCGARARMRAVRRRPRARR